MGELRAIIDFVIPGPPKGKGRPRMTRSGHTYTPKDTAQYENLVKLAFTEAAPDWIPFEDYVSATITAYYPIPKSYSKTKRQLAISGIIKPKKKPDLDNIEKSILDSLNGIAYLDDSQVIFTNTAKKYGEAPRVEVSLVFTEERQERK